MEFDDNFNLWSMFINWCEFSGDTLLFMYFSTPRGKQMRNILMFLRNHLIYVFNVNIFILIDSFNYNSKY